MTKHSDDNSVNPSRKGNDKSIPMKDPVNPSKENPKNPKTDDSDLDPKRENNH